MVLSITAYLIWSTISINQASITKGPVHWHGDFEIWNCGKELDLIDPKGLFNRVGTPVLHEHNDKRIHVEGAVMQTSDISLREFFRVVGGKMTPFSLKIPTNDGVIEMKNGDLCRGDHGQFQVFAYQTKGDGFSQQKLQDPLNYVLSPYSSIPPGDCIILEFDVPKERTDKICLQYRIKK